MGRPWWDPDRRNPFRRETEAEEAQEDSILEGFFRLVMVGLLLLFAGHTPDEDVEWAGLVSICFMALIGYDFRKGAIIWLLPWLVFFGLSQPIWVPNLAEWAWQMLSYVAAGLVLLSWVLPIYLDKHAVRKRTRADARLAAQSAPPQPPAPRTRPHKARSTYPKGHPRHSATGEDDVESPPIA
jgi:hypothetical protein